MFCSKCGNECAEGQSFCTRCGARIEMPTAGTQQVQSESSNAQAAASNGMNNANADNKKKNYDVVFGPLSPLTKSQKTIARVIYIVGFVFALLSSFAVGIMFLLLLGLFFLAYGFFNFLLAKKIGLQGKELNYSYEGMAVGGGLIFLYIAICYYAFNLS